MVGALLCAAAVGLGWWAAAKAIGGVSRVAARLDRGLSEADAGLARVERRLDAVRADLGEVATATGRIAEENPDLPRVRAAVEQLLGRLAPAFDRADAIADSLGSLAAGLRAAADIRDQFGGESELPGRVRSAADTIEGATEALEGLRARIEAARSTKPVRFARELAAMARDAIAGSERLAKGVAAARHEITVSRGRTVEWRDRAVAWVYVAAAANTVVWLWGGLGQLCLVSWGRRRVSHLGPSAP
jgi:hypothetical protein